MRTTDTPTIWPLTALALVGLLAVPATLGWLGVAEAAGNLDHSAWKAARGLNRAHREHQRALGPLPLTIELPEEAMAISWRAGIVPVACRLPLGMSVVSPDGVQDKDRVWFLTGRRRSHWTAELDDPSGQERWFMRAHYETGQCELILDDGFETGEWAARSEERSRCIQKMRWWEGAGRSPKTKGVEPSRPGAKPIRPRRST